MKLIDKIDELIEKQSLGYYDNYSLRVKKNGEYIHLHSSLYVNGKFNIKKYYEIMMSEIKIEKDTICIC